MQVCGSKPEEAVLCRVRASSLAPLFVLSPRGCATSSLWVSEESFGSTQAEWGLLFTELYSKVSHVSLEVHSGEIHPGNQQTTVKSLDLCSLQGPTVKL